ncbi:MarC family protein [Pontiella sp.]|uniref:MarC family protein n=1 Tax=Pontiella sp. TaxID=2837462 RepID=UPI0035653984
MAYLGQFVTIWLKFAFMFTPFFVLTMFLSMTKDYDAGERRRLALRVTGAVVILCIGFFFFGQVVFKLFGITLDAFRIGAGALLFLSSVELVQSRTEKMPTNGGDDEDFAVVPLAMPIVIGPAIIGALFILGAELDTTTERTVGILSLVAASLTLGGILLVGAYIEKVVGKKNLRILSKMTGLILSALAAQMIFTGIRSFLS